MTKPKEPTLSALRRKYIEAAYERPGGMKAAIALEDFINALIDAKLDDPGEGERTAYIRNGTNGP